MNMPPIKISNKYVYINNKSNLNLIMNIKNSIIIIQIENFDTNILNTIRNNGNKIVYDYKFTHNFISNLCHSDGIINCDDPTLAKNICHFITKNDMCDEILLKYLNYFDDDRIKEYDTALIVGKGPSLIERIKRPNSKTLIIAINDSINFCDDFDILCCIDSYNYDKVNEDILRSICNIIIPTYPHVNRIENDRMIQEPTNSLSWKNILAKLNDKKCFPNIHLVQIQTAIKKCKNIQSFNVISSADLSIDYILSKGINNIITVGIGKDVGYSHFIKYQKLTKSPQTWYTMNINSIKNKVLKYGGTITFK